MNELKQKFMSGLAGWIGAGPWRSKSVVAAVLATGVGLLSWVSDVKSGPLPEEAPLITTNTPAIAPNDATVERPEAPSSWQRPLPGYAKVSASYVLGCCLGWFFRRLTRLILVVCGLTIAGLGFGRLAGLDTTDAQEHVRSGSEWARHGLESLTESLKQVAPSAAGGGVGLFMGFWRRRKMAAVEDDA